MRKGKEEIAMAAVDRAHPRLRASANEIPGLDSDADILLLVGRNVPQLRKVHESTMVKVPPLGQCFDGGCFGDRLAKKFAYALKMTINLECQWKIGSLWK